jgi:hypothetical protein
MQLYPLKKDSFYANLVDHGCKMYMNNEQSIIMLCAVEWIEGYWQNYSQSHVLTAF